MELNKLETLLLFDGIAIFFVLSYHAIDGYPNNPLYFSLPFLAPLCLTLFTYSAGYKLVYNHQTDLNQRPFLSKYYIKRFVKLYKAYIGYTVLMLFPLLIVIYISTNFFHLNFEGITTILTVFNHLEIYSFISFFLGGINPIASQLWYLIALIYITSICFTILYFFDIKWLFSLFIPFLLFSLLIQIFVVQSLPDVVFNAFIYLPFFIFGGFWAYYQHDQRGKLFQAAQYFPLLFFILIMASSFLLIFFNNKILIYCSCFFFPFFLLALFVYFKKIKFITSFFTFCGTYSFQIYLFHWPLILPIVTRTMIDIFKIDYFFMPIIATIVAVYLCVITYKMVKKIQLNVLFE